ncbi:hypothetical protein PPL_10640 [Heterostelium album PN500]|uniref:Transmembrane protein n=1 Tax=Heterostelium pallidum (strain ATCC 26659 / Pp 5 / PN500) TaxID=670386 RepID=D3BRM9_HETP5|nr:hypothetical protein PPL_10640 [Heterostelium album PN500]EFA76061.1 hypothetical protein PPL_10640 [Heterostelium album PN500]|eukprot:XP_020428195.1 hypothetical protein PPL_10640 [Heterostelium album PN500]
MGYVGKLRVTLWTVSIILMLAGSLGVIIYNKSEGMVVTKKPILGQVWWNAIIGLHAIYLIGTGFEILSRAYLMMVGSTCSEQRRVFLCCFLYSMMSWWKLMIVIGVISFIILAGVTGIIIAFDTSIKMTVLIRLAASTGVSAIQILFTTLSFVSSRKLQRRQDEEEEALHGPKKEETSSQSKDAPPAIIKSNKEEDKSSQASGTTAGGDSNVVPA